jgi:hypothetical protein
MFNQIFQKGRHKLSLFVAARFDKRVTRSILDQMKKELAQILFAWSAYRVERNSDQCREVVNKSLRVSKAKRIPTGIPQLLESN